MIKAIVTTLTAFTLVVWTKAENAEKKVQVCVAITLDGPTEEMWRRSQPDWRFILRIIWSVCKQTKTHLFMVSQFVCLVGFKDGCVYTYPPEPGPQFTSIQPNMAKTNAASDFIDSQ